MARFLFPLLCIALCAAASAAEPMWGGLKLRIVYDGPPPERAKLPIGLDEFYCGKFDIRDESLLVDKEGGLANVVVWLDPNKAIVPVHPDYEKTAKETTIDTRGCRFEPHVSVMRTTQTLVLRNSDAIANNVKLESLQNDAFNFLLNPEGTRKVTLDKAERIPSRITNSIHAWQSAYLFVHDHPYVGVSDAGGNVEIAKLPVGKWTFIFWQERSGYLREVEKTGTKLEWPKGRVEIEIKSGQNDFGEIKVKPETFVRR